MMRKIVQIDETKCDGCGLCVPACHEGAIQIIDGKARLVADKLCDGLGDCLGECPLDAIKIIERDADEFDEEAVHLRLRELGRTPEPAPVHGGCPGSRAMSMPRTETQSKPIESGRQESQLGQWPVQLHLVPVNAPYFMDSELLVCADCVPFAYPDFHRKMLRGKTVTIACPKLDQTGNYAAKLAEIIKNNRISQVTVAHMEVPCCSALVSIVRQAVELSGCGVDLGDITVKISGEAVATL
jgi:Fe-S-cluster-containing hydrogenase component 2